jgi:hypothetical protein
MLFDLTLVTLSECISFLGSFFLFPRCDPDPIRFVIIPCACTDHAQEEMLAVNDDSIKGVPYVRTYLLTILFF